MPLLVLVIGAVLLAVLDQAIGMKYDNFPQSLIHKVGYMLWGGFIALSAIS